MVLDRVITAKIVAYDAAWVDPEGFAQCAERGIIYVQTHYLLPDTPFSFFTIGKGDEKIVIKRLEELNQACSLVLALPYNAISHEMLSLLSTIESRWNKKHINQKPSDPLEGLYDSCIVADIGADMKTKEAKYACRSYPVESICKDILEEFQINRGGADLDIQSLSDSTMQAALKQRFVRIFGKANKGWTLKEVEEFAQAKKWMSQEQS